MNTPPAAGLKREDLEDLRELMLATWGMAPKSESLRKFVASQTWYVPKPDVTIDRLARGKRRRSMSSTAFSARSRAGRESVRLSRVV